MSSLPRLPHYAKGLTAIALLVLSALQNNAYADTSTLSEQLLQSFYDTAGVCTTSTILSIVEANDLVEVAIDIQPDTAIALRDASDALRDDWFSLHCPPEIHGVWKQAKPPSDVTISASISDSVQHELSCREYQSSKQIETGIYYKFLQKITRLLDF